MNLFGIHPVPWSASDDGIASYRFAAKLEPVAPMTKCPTAQLRPADALGKCLQCSADSPNYMKSGNCRFGVAIATQGVTKYDWRSGSLLHRYLQSCCRTL